MVDDDVAARFWSKVRKAGDDDCWEWSAGRMNFKGYGGFSFHGRSTGAHRVAWMIALGEIPDGLCVLHRCDRPSCVNPRHLFLGTNGDNNRDRSHKGRTAKPQHQGSRNPLAKLTEADVVEIRRLRAELCMTQQAIADIYGVCQGTVSRAIHGKGWSHVV